MEWPTKLAEFSDSHWRIQQLKAALMHCAKHHCPLVIHGPPGSGRTSMTAAISQFCRSWLSSPHAVVAARVLASSPASMTIEYVLSTICYQLSEVRATVWPRLWCIQLFVLWQHCIVSQKLKLLVQKLSSLIRKLHLFKRAHRVRPLAGSIPGHNNVSEQVVIT